ncbi:uncharacterized protein Z520_02249 [Fonsecaea multimorphosa CBS 102226]|uniref:DUF202 domain-containing protein n=1 Tax=Fonsecaea multimorphosa CBS 102226 TaxID=1442371 RepID=A0A0D2HJN5_9EURO|nr:uncharacterized protein Z520_02249 [Fonsecaea multimorphosa CBS 102226]KIY02111.1 hypothetical protein Z520_02249 [Fonsecaea multimorphosa CBS 102226]OAL29310.1 hypothetical protein AYO22_02204 [Fonsecaea multimorphosa]
MDDGRNSLTSPARGSGEQHEELELNTLRRKPTQADSSSDAIPQNTASRETHKSPWRTWTKSLSPLFTHHVPLRAARDHLANERVFLGYIRTSSALANFAITILQLYRLKHDPVPRGILSDYDLGIPFAVVTLVIGVAITLAGAWRFFACQSAMAQRKQIATSGWVVLVFMPAVAFLLLALMILTIIVNPNL